MQHATCLLDERRRIADYGWWRCTTESCVKVPSIVLRDQPTSVSAKLACWQTVRTAYVSLLRVGLQTASKQTWVTEAIYYSKTARGS